VTIRGVAAALDARPMGLSAFIDRKDDLIALMVDEVLGEAVIDPVPGDWRDTLTAIAHAIHDAFARPPGWRPRAAGCRRSGPT
jgi:hypothetical protein